MPLGVQGGAVGRGVARSASLQVDNVLVLESLPSEGMSHVLELERNQRMNTLNNFVRV